MFDDILKMVKEHFGNNPEVANAIPADQADAVHHEIANHITNGLANQQVTNDTTNQAVNQGGSTGLLGTLENAIASGGTLTHAIEGGLVGSLASKFGLSPLVTGAIAGALPGLLQKIANRRANNTGV